MSLSEKVKASIERLKAFEPKSEPYYLAFSGGKDSVVVKALMDMAGVKYDAHYRVTSVDPPELVQFIKDRHPDVARDIPHYPDTYRVEALRGKPITMWNLIPHKLMPPTRLVRYCCAMLKESGGDGRKGVTGVRWAESKNRKANQGVVTVYNKKSELVNNPDFMKTNRGGVVLVNDNEDSRRMIETCYKRNKTVVNPIIDWTNSDVWTFIRGETIPYCKLYDEGWNRLGCIGCAMASLMERELEFLRWPTYKRAYLMAFGKMLEERIRRGKMDGTWRIGTTPEDVFNWWMEYKIVPGQMSFEDLEDSE